MPEGDSVAITYDRLSNPLTVTWTPKPGSAEAEADEQLVRRLTYTVPVAALSNFEEAQTITDPNGNVTTNTYDPTTGNLTQISQPVVPVLGGANAAPVQLFTYTAIGLPHTTEDAEGRTTRFDYDPTFADELVKTTVDDNPAPPHLNLVTQNAYDAYGDVTAVTDANGNVSTSSYDAQRRLIEIEGPASTGVVTKYTYYPDGQVKTAARLAVAKPASYETTSYAYTLADKLSVVTDPRDATTTYTYDVDERTETVTQQVTTSQNRQRTYAYDPLSRLTQISDTTNGAPGTALESHSYWPDGRDQTFVDANGHAIDYAYDGFNRPKTTTYPDASTEAYTHDANGNALQKTTRSGSTIAFTYDALNRASTKTPQGEVGGQVHYGYDRTGRLGKAWDASSATPYLIGYDTAGRPVSYTDQLGRMVLAGLDGVGNRVSLQWPAGSNGTGGAYFVTYQYDGLNRMKEIDESGSASKPLAKYSWDLLSRTTLITYGDGTTDAYANYDAADNPGTLTTTFTGGGAFAFTYGWFLNHQRESTSVNSAAYQYAPTAGTISYGAANVDNGYTTVGGKTLAYDGNRNLSSDGTYTLTHDVENRLTGAALGTVTEASFLYDPLGHRKQQTAGAAVTQYVLAGADEVADYNGVGGAALILTVRGTGGLPVAAITPAAGTTAESIEYYHHDVLGTTFTSTKAGVSGPNATYLYSDFGTPNAGPGVAYRFAGYRLDAATGYYYVRARYYSPALGRFLEPDPIGTTGGANIYAYVGNDPLNGIDPLGLYRILVVTFPDGTQYFPQTTVKNDAQASSYGAAKGSQVWIAVPSNLNPQQPINQWGSGSIFNGVGEFAIYWRPGGPNDYKLQNPMYDAFGNFEYGGTGESLGISYDILQFMGNVIHGGTNNSINYNDIFSGFQAIYLGGTLSTQDYNPPNKLK
jgi:RHS repeat-associated protein